MLSPPIQRSDIIPNKANIDRNNANISTEESHIASSPNDSNLNTSMNENYDESINEYANIKLLPKIFSTLPFPNEIPPKIEHDNDEVLLTLPNTTSYLEKEELRLGILAKYTNNKNNYISPTKIILNEDKRTSVIIKNIPKQYLPKTLLSELLKNKDLKGKFNFFYLPYKTNTNSNYGYAIINFINPLHVITFYEMYNKKYFNKYANDKRLEISFININTRKRNNYQDDTCEVLLPLKYLNLYKKVNRRAVCVVKDVNMYNDGMFVVKKLRKNM